LARSSPVRPTPGGQRPAEDADLVASHGGQPGGAPVTHRPVQEQRGGRPRQRGDGQAGQQERGQHREHVLDDLTHPPIRPSAGDGTQSVFLAAGPACLLDRGRSRSI
jgi:hypothetical protein